jgi:hypothetical protein
MTIWPKHSITDSTLITFLGYLMKQSVMRTYGTYGQRIGRCWAGGFTSVLRIEEQDIDGHSRHLLYVINKMNAYSSNSCGQTKAKSAISRYVI